MSTQLLHFFFADSAVKKDEDEPKLLWKVVLRTGTWKLRPGPGGVKLKEQLKIYRDKAPKGHVSMSSLVANFDAGAKENVTVPTIHADGTVADNGFVRKLVIQDVPSEDGSGKTQSLLWAGLEITEPDILGKIERKTLVGVSGGILFGYERTEDGKKFDQILSHVMITNSPWIGGTGGFTDKLPEGVMASEPDDLPVGELELDSVMLDAPVPIGDGDVVFESRSDLSLGRRGKVTATRADATDGVIVHDVRWDDGETSDGMRGFSLRKVVLADGEATDPTKKPQPPSGEVVWKPSEGFAWIKGKLQRALDERRRTLMAQFGEAAYRLDYPYYSVDDIQGDGTSGKALICSGYGSERESWVAQFKIEDSDDGHDDAIIEAFQNWTPAKQEWVAAAEQDPSKPDSRQGKPPKVQVRLTETPLRRAQRERDDRIRNGGSSTPTTGGSMKLSELQAAGVELSDEQVAAITADEERQAERDRQLDDLLKDQRKGKATALLASVKDTPLDTPGVKKYIESIVTSDDGGTALEFSEETESGARTQPVNKTATEIVEGFLAVLPRDEHGKLTLSQQARKLPNDPKPSEEEEENEDDKKSASEKSDAFLAELADQGLDIGVAATSQNGGK